MGLPQIFIDFQAQGASAIRRSKKGVALLLFTHEGEADILHEYTSSATVSTEYGDEARAAIVRCLSESPRKVIALSLYTTSGELDEERALEALKGISFNWLGLCCDIDKGFVRDFILSERAKGNYVKAVMNSGRSFDHPAFVVLSNASVTIGERVYDEGVLVPYIVGRLAQLPLGDSITYGRFSDVTAYTPSNDEGAEVDLGRLVLIRDSRGFKVARGVTNLTTFGTFSEDMSKIKIVEAMDTIMGDIKLSLEESYIGKMKNDYDSKLLLCLALQGYFDALGDSVLDRSYGNKVAVSLSGQENYLRSHGIDTGDMSDLEILKANTGSHVFLEGVVRFVDAMEDISFVLEM